MATNTGAIGAFVLVFALLLSSTRPVQLPSDPKPPPAQHETLSRSNSLNVCLKQDQAKKPNDALACFGQQMLNRLQDLEERDEFALTDGVSMRRDESGPRDISNYLDRDPMDFRSIVEGASTLMSRRQMQWDMSFLHPGLTMRVGPTLTGNGVLEFVMDPKVRDRDHLDHRDHQEVSTARLISRHLIVPFLLGFKFQLSTLLPLLFGVMVLLSKKALILAKIAVIASSFFGYNSLFSSGVSHGGGYYGGPGLGAYGNRYFANDYLYKNNENVDNVDEPSDSYYGSSSNHFHHQPQQQQQQQTHDYTVFKSGPAQSPEELRDRLERLFAAKHNKDRNGQRNFSWKD